MGVTTQQAAQVGVTTHGVKTKREPNGSGSQRYTVQWNTKVLSESAETGILSEGVAKKMYKPAWGQVNTL